MEQKFRVLSLDGGGARGYLTAAILKNIEQALSEDQDCKRPLGRYFDFIVGTSTGAILAAGLACGVSAERLFDLYQNQLPNIFHRPGRLRRLLALGSLRRPKYESWALHRVLYDVLGDKRLSDVDTDLCIVSMVLQTGLPRLYKSGYLGRNSARLDERLVDVVMASAAAPVYFPPASGLRHSGLLVDGGLCANNPALIAVLDAIQFDGPSRSRGTPSLKHVDDPLKRVVLLSIGTGERPGLPFNAPDLANAGLWKWVSPRVLCARIFGQAPGVPLLELVFEGQTRLTQFQVQLLLKSGHYLRINPRLGRSHPLDDTRHLQELLNYADLNQAAHAWVMEHLAPERRGQNKGSA